MNRDVLELLNELNDLIDTFSNSDDNIPASLLKDFIDNQRSIYGGAQGECAS